MVLLVSDRGAIMTDEMGSFRVDIEIENPARPGERQEVRSVLADTGAELSWILATVLESLGIRRYRTARFRQASRAIEERPNGAAYIHAVQCRPAEKSD